jgi:heterodisulfide reductase subunit B
LAKKHLDLQGSGQVRHLLDVIVKDIGPAAIRKKIKKPLSDLRIAPYYGCQCLRPYQMFDDPEKPVSMEPIIAAVGATVYPWDMGGKCCGAAHMNTKMEVGLQLVQGILEAAKDADAIVTVCPMCQMNLEGFQNKLAAKYRDDVDLTILYLPQLLGLALGLEDKQLEIELNLAITDRFKAKIDKLHR